ncbi:capsule biosynthesis protein [Planktotalea sp.]|uniref:capsule biosynthesis protein n=1 Tax=Planktotalea sp. TaxID=2029877 RepID=UPI003D6C243C
MPVLISAWYLWMRAADQYASTFAFSIRSEETSSGIELLGGIADFSGSGANDSDVIYDYLRSQHLVEKLQASLNIAKLWATPKRDPIFTYDNTGLIEDLHEHWTRMVDVSHDSTRAIIEVRTKAFDAETAVKINQEILRLCSELINRINSIAHEDAVRYALDDLQRTKTRLTDARTELTEYRVLNQMIDPSIDMGSQESLLSTLESQLTETLIDIEMLSANTRRSDTRLTQAKQRRAVLQARIDEERANRTLEAGNGGQVGLARLYGDYERLIVEVEFAEQSYQAARASFEAAVSDARRKTRYLAAHVLPTRAEQSLFPKRGLILGLVTLACFLVWSLITLIGFSFLDRR